MIFQWSSAAFIHFDGLNFVTLTPFTMRDNKFQSILSHGLRTLCDDCNGTLLLPLHILSDVCCHICRATGNKLQCRNAQIYLRSFSTTAHREQHTSTGHLLNLISIPALFLALVGSPKALFF